MTEAFVNSVAFLGFPSLSLHVSDNDRHVLQVDCVSGCEIEFESTKFMKFMVIAQLFFESACVCSSARRCGLTRFEFPIASRGPIFYFLTSKFHRCKSLL